LDVRQLLATHGNPRRRHHRCRTINIAAIVMPRARRGRAAS
jgi:hypothetical protein